MKKQLLLLFAFLCSCMGMWAQDKSWTYKFVDTSVNVTNKQFTVNGATWTIGGTVGAGSPSLPTASTKNAYNKNDYYNLKFGSSSSSYFSTITFTTDYFTNKKVTKVELLIRNNGSQPATITVKQGGNQIGTKEESKSSDWKTYATDCTGSTGGTLEIAYTVAQACYVQQITVYYKDDSTPAISHTASFSVNGKIDSDKSASIEEGETITFPANPSDINGKTFMGWIKGTSLDGETDEAPVFVDTKIEKMGKTDIVYYAVFATKNIGEGEPGSYTLDYSQESDLASSTEWDYNTVLEYTATDGSVWTVRAYKNAGMQLNKGKGAYIKVPNCPGNITSINITAGSNQTINFGSTDNDATTVIAFTTDKKGTIDLSEKNVTTGYLWSSTGATTLTKIIVNYGKLITYSDYCTTVETPAPVAVTVNNCGNASFSCGKALDFTNADIKAYMVTAETAESVTITEIKKVPAYTGIFVVGEGGTYNIPVLNGEADDVSANKLVATITPKAVIPAENIWALSKNDGKLHHVTSGTITTGKAYFVSSINNNTAEARGFVFVDDENTTGINSAATVKATGVAFNLAGQRVAPNAKGIVIVNGKKFINK